MTRKHNRPDPVVDLLEAILTGRPSLPNALCIGQWELFDAARYHEPGTGQTVALVAAERLCRACPHNTRCPDSLEARPHQEMTA